MNEDDVFRRKARKALAKIKSSRKRMTYPIIARTISMDHKGGTKFYNIMLVEAADGRCVLVTRWGRTGTLGEVKSDLFDNQLKGQQAFDRKEREKTRREYQQKGPAREVIAADASELPKAIGLAVFNKMGAEAVHHLDTGFDISGMRSQDPPAYEENTGRKIDTARRADISDMMAETRRQEEEKVAREYADNPNYARF